LIGYANNLSSPNKTTEGKITDIRAALAVYGEKHKITKSGAKVILSFKRGGLRGGGLGINSTTGKEKSALTQH
jgi:hypothetical protein